MSIREKLMRTLDDMESVARLFNTPRFDIYFLGGAACVLGEYSTSATHDFDFIDLNYGADMGRVFAILRDYDMLEYESTILAPDYKSRAKKLNKYRAFNAYVLGPEDIVVSKIIRMDKKDIQDIDEIIGGCDKGVINAIIEKVMKREDLYESKKQGFLLNMQKFRGLYRV